MLVWTSVSLFIRFIILALQHLVKKDRLNYLNVRLKG